MRSIIPKNFRYSFNKVKIRKKEEKFGAVIKISIGDRRLRNRKME